MLSDLRDRLFDRIDGRPDKAVVAFMDTNRPVAPENELHPNRLANRVPAPELVAVPREDYLSDESLHPRLLVLREAGDRGYRDESLLRLTLDCAQRRRTSINGAYVCGWLIIDAPVGEVAAQLRRSLVVNDAFADKRRVVPLFEPHRMVLASQMASPQWLARWLGSISSWFLIDVCGQLREIRPVLHDVEQPGELPDAEFWKAQSRVPRARQVLLALTKAGQAIPVDCEFRIDQALRAACREGLSEAEDVIFFAVNHMTLEPEWHVHPAIRGCIEKAKSGEAMLTDSVTSLPDHVLNELAVSDIASSASNRTGRT